MDTDQFSSRPIVKNKELFLTFLFELLDDNDAVEWENDDIYSLLQAMAAWSNNADGFYKNINIEFDRSNPSWQLFFDMLVAATVYE